LTLDSEVEDSSVVNNGTDTIRSLLLVDGNHSWSVTCFDLAGHINSSQTVNFSVYSPPQINLNFPDDEYMTLDSSIQFNYTPVDALGFDNCSIYFDSVLNQTSSSIVKNVVNSFTIPGITEGVHNWSVHCFDSDKNYNYSETRTFSRDISPPTIELISPFDESSVDFAAGSVLFRWRPIDLYDDFFECDLYVDGSLEADDKFVGNDSIVVESVSGLGIGEHTWNVTCFDELGNTNDSATWSFNLTRPDFYIDSDEIYFNTTSPKENETINITATVQNIGYAPGTNIMVQFFKGNPLSGGTQIGNNQTVDLNGSQEVNVSQNYLPQIGLNEIYVIVDQYDDFTEFDENNNLANKNMSVGAWQFFYGDILSSANYSLDDNSSDSVIDWSIDSYSGGSVFVSDVDSSVSWANVLAIGKNTLGGASSSDLSEIDSLLSMTGFQDSIENLYLGDEDNFRVFDREVTNVLITNSTNNTNFVTGILWDSSDTIGDNEFDSTDSEDLIFVSKIEKDLAGTYGTYDYEMRVPATLRSYAGVGSNSVAFYLELY
jgi:hypothetical protein